MSFKENWLKVDETCPHCKQVTQRQRGLTQQNVKRLFWPTWTINEILLTFMLAMIILLAVSYNYETKISREWLKDMSTNNLTSCISTCNYKCNLIQGIYVEDNSSKVNEIYKMNLTFAK